MRIFHTVVYEKKLKKLFQNEHVPIWHQRLKHPRWEVRKTLKLVGESQKKWPFFISTFKECLSVKKEIR